MAIFYKKVLSDGSTLLKYLPNPVHIGWSTSVKEDEKRNYDPLLEDGFEIITEREFVNIEVKIVAENFKTKLLEELAEGKSLKDSYNKRLRFSGSKLSPSGIQYSDLVKEIYPISYFEKQPEKEFIEDPKDYSKLNRFELLKIVREFSEKNPDKYTPNHVWNTYKQPELLAIVEKFKL